MFRRGLLSMAVWMVSMGANAQTGQSTLHLFTDTLKQVISPTVCNFLERYLYQASQSKRGYDFYQHMADDKVIIRGGSLDNIKRLSQDALFEINRYEDKGYEVGWKDVDGNMLLSLQFPINYELLLGMPKVEIEKTMKEQLKACADTTAKAPSDSLFEKISGDLYSSQPVEHYYVESLNTAKYYLNLLSCSINLEGKVDLIPMPLFDEDHKAYSAANLFHGIISVANHYRIHIDQNLYGFQKESYIVPLNKWLNYCLENKFKVYCGVEEERIDGVKLLVIAKNADLGYCHMMTVILPSEFVANQNTVLRATLNAYIPLDNLKDLYQEHSKKDKKNE